jgi:hypothetical protein
MNLEELNSLAPSDTILLIHDLDQVLKISQICIERCHFEQYNIHMCLQALLQLGYMEYVMNSCQRWWQFKLVFHVSTLLMSGE